MKYREIRAAALLIPVIPIRGIERRRTERGALVFRVKAGRKIGDGFGEVCLGDNVIVFAVFIRVGDMIARCAEGE
jgi:hypothetical protein